RAGRKFGPAAVLRGSIHRRVREHLSQKGASMRRRRRLVFLALAVALAVLAAPSSADAACCYFSAQNNDVLQPGQKVFITWDPEKKQETFTVQPRFEGNALDFGMVIPTPAQPKLHEMPRDFFKHLAVYTIMKKREFPKSKLFPQLGRQSFGKVGGAAGGKGKAKGGGDADMKAEPEPTVKVI